MVVFARTGREFMIFVGVVRRGNRARVDGGRMRVEGRVRWTRFALVFVPGALVMALLVDGILRGAIGAAFIVADGRIKASAAEVRQGPFASYGGFVVNHAGEHIPVLVNKISHITAIDFCQSVIMHTPIGPVTLRATGGHDRPVTARNLTTYEAMLAGDVTYFDLEVNRDAATLDAVPGFTGPPGDFGQQGSSGVVRNFREVNWAVTADMFSIPDAKVTVRRNGPECF
ncbi:DUF6230 family protein [Sphaerisporangium sp. B11E5]|uniref:DUF6230 family protein n=1 Tax=Sphaerisporangium sp. B11E5 TaxID=3153563 RepID=UPI00325F0188